MHQTVREFFLRPNGHVAKSKFMICTSYEYAHARISITCLRYLMLCAASGLLDNELPTVDQWTSENFETYTQYLNDRPFINYALSYLKRHMDNCRQDTHVLNSVSQLTERLTDGPALFLLGNWVSSNLNAELPALELSESAEDFKTQILHTAARMGFSLVVEALLVAGAQVEARLRDKTPLIASAERGDDTTVRLLIAAGANKEAKDSSGKTALHHASSQGHYSTVNVLIKTIGTDKEAEDTTGQTALHVAAGGGYDGIVRLLIDEGADISAIDRGGHVPLHLAAESGNDNVVKLLVYAGANVNATRSADGRTPLCVAVNGGHEKIVKLLLDCGADINARPENDPRKTALNSAVESGNVDMVGLLLDAGAEVDAELLELDERIAKSPAGTKSENMVKLLQYARSNIWAAAKNGDLNILEKRIEACTGKYT